MEANYIMIPNYTMKCRLYPNREQAKAIDDAIYAVQCYHNCVMWDIFNNHVATKEVPYKPKKGEVSPDAKIQPGDPVHFIMKSLKEVFTKEYKAALIAAHPVIEKAPAGAITTNVGLKSDMAREFSVSNQPIEFRDPTYYHKGHPRRSYTYQETLGKVIPSENPHVLYMNLNKIGKVKLRGWNKKIRFDPEATMNFMDCVKMNPKQVVTVTVSRDSVGDYWLCFKLTNVFKEVPIPTGGSIGVDVGIKDIAITSNGKKYDNKKFKKEAAKRHRRLNRKLSRRQGWANIRFREAHKADETLTVSRKYERTKRRLSKVDRRTARRRESWNNQISWELVRDNSYIGVESLNVKGMFRNRHLANALSDAGLYQLLLMIQYKAGWYGRTVQPIDQWTPSSKRCSSCKNYFYKKLTLSVRNWKCPVCGAYHDRDVNAAINILDYALEITAQQTEN